MRFEPWRRQRAVSPVGGGPSGLPDLGLAPELLGISCWMNVAGATEPALADLRGRVVMLEFWTFACINCIRTLPFVQEMHRTYWPELAVIGIHTPELRKERDPDNVARAIDERGLTYPVGLDNDFATWNAYGNRYWPSTYLIDHTGRLRYAHYGEGKYRQTKAAIGKLVAEVPKGLTQDVRPPGDPSGRRVPTVQAKSQNAQRQR